MNTAAKVAEHTMGPSPSLATPTQPKLHPTEKMKACVYQGVKNVKLVEVNISFFFDFILFRNCK